MAVARKLRCRVERVIDHGERVYTVDLSPEHPAPRFRAGQFLHLALDAYDPSRFWPESRVFSIASAPSERSLLRITYAVHGRFTTRMEQELVTGRQAWVKMPYGDFVIDDRDPVVLFAGGTGITAFTAFLEGLEAGARQPVAIAYGARNTRLLIYRDVVERCAGRVPSVEVSYFVEERSSTDLAGFAGSSSTHEGRVSVAEMWPRLPSPLESAFYVSGPPAMLHTISADLRARGVAAEAIHIDAWE